MPVPRKLSSNCGIVVEFSKAGTLEDIITDDIEKIYRLENKIHSVIIIVNEEEGDFFLHEENFSL